jgi:cell division transport system permease protein
MKLRLLPYFVKQAMRSIFSNRGVHAIGMGTMVVSLLIFGTFLLLFVNLNAWVQGWGHAMSMSVYLQDDVDESRRDEIAAFIQNLPTAEIERFVSKRRALLDLKRSLGSQAGVLDGLSHNPLPASFEVAFSPTEAQPVDLHGVKQALEKMDGVSEVQFSEEWLHRFKGLMNIVKLVGIVVGGLLCLGIVFIVTNTIKLTIYSRREEIEILKMVGATDWFVKIPFLLEGAIQGIISGVSAIGLLYLGYVMLTTKKMHFLGLAGLDFIFLPYSYSLSIVLISLSLGLLGCFIAVGRFFQI